jgi:hypothetical protein
MKKQKRLNNETYTEHCDWLISFDNGCGTILKKHESRRLVDSTAYWALSSPSVFAFVVFIDLFLITSWRRVFCVYWMWSESWRAQVWSIASILCCEEISPCFLDVLVSSKWRPRGLFSYERLDGGCDVTLCVFILCLMSFCFHFVSGRAWPATAACLRVSLSAFGCPIVYFDARLHMIVKYVVICFSRHLFVSMKRPLNPQRRPPAIFLFKGSRVNLRIDAVWWFSMDGALLRRVKAMQCRKRICLSWSIYRKRYVASYIVHFFSTSSQVYFELSWKRKASRHAFYCLPIGRG